MGQYQKGESGNPRGRPVGSGLQVRLRAAVGDRFDELVQVILDAALQGDMTAANLLLSRLVPSVKAVQEPTAFRLEGATMTEKAHSILTAVAAGELSAADGKALLDGVGGVVKVQDAEQTARQIELIKLSLDASNRKAA
ncbi:MAG: hypothetical protein RLZZ09_110 [Pseudomonadota bacterium]|jgi:hypothetical protein